MKKNSLLIVFIFVSKLIFAQDINSENTEIKGYIQIRGISNFDDYSSFSVRRLKFWIKSKPEFSKYWSYKIQTTFTSFQQEKFFLQDVKINYKTGLFSLDIGQFVPQYSLQRFQADYKIPVIERAKVTNILIPNGTLGARDIGLQGNFKTKNNCLSTHLGIFNGYGIKEYRFNNQGYLLTHKSELNIPLLSNNLKIGYSLQYRNAKNLELHAILPDSVLFSGDDFRYNLFANFNTKLLELQAEFLNATLNKEKAYGYYFLSSFNLNKNQIVLSFESYNDLIKETNDKPYYRIGYNYLINNNKIKLLFDNYFQINNSKIENYIASIQLQLFIN